MFAVCFNQANWNKLQNRQNFKLKLEKLETFDDDGVIRFVDAAADRADGQNKKPNGHGEEKRKMKKTGQFLVVT